MSTDMYQLDREREAHRRRYRVAKAGMFLLAAGAALRAADSAGHLVFLLTPHFGLGKIIGGPLWQWGFGAPINAALLIGSYLLIGCWDDRLWKTRVGVLVTASTAASALWLLTRAQDFGLPADEVGHYWLREQVRSALSWVQFLMIARLSADVAEHTGDLKSHEPERAALRTARVGLAFWFLIFLFQTKWSRGWPLVGGFPAPFVLMLWMGSLWMRLSAGRQLTALCLLAGRGCAGVLNDLDREEAALNPSWKGAHPFDEP